MYSVVTAYKLLTLRPLGDIVDTFLTLLGTNTIVSHIARLRTVILFVSLVLEYVSKCDVLVTWLTSSTFTYYEILSTCMYSLVTGLARTYFSIPMHLLQDWIHYIFFNL